ncbi:CASP-like protein 4A3 [Malania oleifera]|uniref:CASP-like protein 4A3 n=1 Tax=Malania oleifera TaxID=397392 RepID=UPI0025ADA42F|nr:CASP-like protein 4A3 [Malania oleifera]XP_057984028.1 CASP-like protein 4A3 [Malania oleifera]XP_057984029.1 CASP-like protein 4A3 [Malania oleifera]
MVKKQENQFVSPTSAAMDSSPPSPPRDRPPLSPTPEESPRDSAASSDHTSRGYSPRENERPASPPALSWSPAAQLRDQPPSPVVVVMNRVVREEPMAVVAAKVDPGDRFPGRVAEEGGGSSGEGQRSRRTLSIVRRAQRESMVKKAALGLRVCGFVFCLISFSVLAADRNRGWSLDSFDRYKEFRYCISVTVIGAGYSALQAYHISMDAGKVLPRHLHFYFDFSMDQILAYLLLSASSSAATRVDDWKSNWGEDKFPEMASASVGMSFMAFVAFALSSLISGYTLSTLIHT